MRAHVVAFGEKVDATAMHTVRRALPDADLFIAVGISGQTMAPLGLAMQAAKGGVPTVAITLNPSPSIRRIYGLCLDIEADRLDEILRDPGRNLTRTAVPAGSLTARIAAVTTAR